MKRRLEQIEDPKKGLHLFLQKFGKNIQNSFEISLTFFNTESNPSDSVMYFPIAFTNSNPFLVDIAIKNLKYLFS